MARIEIEMYTRPGCHLCDTARGVIEAARHRYDFDFRVVNVEATPELEARYGADIPVVRINGGPAFEHRVDADEFERTLERLWNR